MEKKKRKSKKSRRARQVKAKIITFVVAVALIIIVGLIAFGGRVKESMENGEDINARWFLALLYPDKYAYSSDLMDMNEYFQLFASDDVAIILQNERIEDRGKLYEGRLYFSLDTVASIFTKRFYYNAVEQVLLYTTSTDIMSVNLASQDKCYTDNGSPVATDYLPALYIGDQPYICADYVKMFDNFSYDLYLDPNRAQVYTIWEERNEATVLKKTKLRYQGGIKSQILTSLEKDDKVTVLEAMETWSKVKTSDGYLGYVENTRLSATEPIKDAPVTGAYVAKDDYLANPLQDKIVLGWHQIFYADDGSNLNSILPASATAMNVVCPTWFYTDSEKGTFVSYASSAYVDNAHGRGLKVWALCEDMTNDFDEYALFSSSENRRAFINNLINAVKEVGADGINMDFEKIGKDTGPHYIQFLRELSIETRKNGLVLSVDNYQQNQGNLYYNLGEQGLVCDYVIIMDYDEHWSGSAEAGSVASAGFVERGITSALESGVPPYKLVNGMPFYTRLWKKEGDKLTSEAIGMDTASEWVESHGLTPGWDEECCQYYVTRESGTAVYEMWMENADSIKAKLSIGQNYDIAGVACWRLGLESSDIWGVIGESY